MEWPPLIKNAHLPWWARWRDAVLTVIAWLVLAYLIRDLLLAACYWMLDRLGIAHAAPPWPPGAILRDLQPFMGAVGLLVVWLVVFVLVRWRLLTSTRPAPSQPEPLRSLVPVGNLGISPADRATLQESVVMTVRMRQDGTVSGVDPDPLGPDRPAG